MEILFWLCVGAMFYTYIAFPAWMIARARKHSLPQMAPPAELPRVAVLIPAYNEEVTIRRKLENILQLEYPRDRLEVWVGSDASTDATDAIVADYAARYPWICHARFPQRRGKVAVLNRLVERCNADIVVFTDADVLLEPRALLHLVGWFADQKTGLVGARLVLVPPNRTHITAAEQQYRTRESQLKHAESLLFGAIMGADGACYAMRRTLFVPFPETRIVTDDLYQTLQVLRQGYHALYAREALCFVDAPVTLSEEYRRKYRMALGNMGSIAALRSVLLRPGRIAFLFISHKLLRWCGGAFLVGGLVSSAALWHTHPFYTAAAIACAIAAVSPLVPLLDTLPLLAQLRHFVAMNYALLHGMLAYALGKTTPWWQPPPRAHTEQMANGE